jgi:hypothetical protein
VQVEEEGEGKNGKCRRSAEDRGSKEVEYEDEEEEDEYEEEDKEEEEDDDAPEEFVLLEDEVVCEQSAGAAALVTFSDAHIVAWQAAEDFPISTNLMAIRSDPSHS